MIPGLETLPDKVRYRNTFLRTVVAELRFRPLMKIARSDLMSEFHEKIEPIFPEWSHENEITFGLGSPPSGLSEVRDLASGVSWTFRSDDGHQLRLRAGAIAIETSQYRDFEAFMERFATVLSAFRATFGDPTLNRLGVRKVNMIPDSEIGATEALRDVFVPLHASVLAPALREVRTAVTLDADPGVARVVFGSESEGPTRMFRFDIDRYVEASPSIDEAASLLTALSDDVTTLFRWSISESLHTRMGPEEKSNG